MERRRGLPKYKGSTKLYVLLAVVIVIEACAILVQATILARAITAAFQQVPIAEFQLDIWLFFGALALRMTCHLLTRTLSEKFAQQTTEYLRNKLVYAYFTSSFARTNQYGTARLTTLAVDGIQDFKTYLEMIGLRMIRGFLIPFIIFIYVFTIDRPSAYILALAVPLIIVFMILLGLAAQKMADKQYETYKRLANHFVDSLKGLVTLKFLGKSKEHADSIGRVSKNYREATMRTLRLAFLSSFALNFFTSLAIAFVAVGLGFRLIDGIIVLQPALIILILAPEYFLPIQQVGADYHATLDGQIAENEINTFIEEVENDAPKVQERIPQMQAIEFRNVHVQINEESILDDIHFTLPQRGNVALVGASGAGKTTILQLLAGQLQQTSGDILINNENKNIFQNKHWLQQIAFIPQHPYIFPLSLKDNLRFYHQAATDQEIHEVIEKIGLAEMVNRFPKGVDERIGEGGRTLSGGQEQRVALARALLSDKRIILLDEPTAHLDIETEYEIKQFILEEFSDRLVVLSTHRLHWVAEMDLVLNIQDGAIIDTMCDPNEMTKDVIYKNYSEKGAYSNNA